MKPLTPLKIGSRGKLFNLDLKVIGRMIYVQRDEGENYYWENLVCTSSDGKEYWIDYDKYAKQYSLYKEVSFDVDAFNQSKNRKIIPKNEDNIRIIERGSAKIVVKEGQLPKEIAGKASIKFIDAIGGKGKYSLEWNDPYYKLFAGQDVEMLVMFKTFKVSLEDPIAKENLKPKPNWLERNIVTVIVMVTIGIIVIVSEIKEPGSTVNFLASMDGGGTGFGK